MNNGKLSNGKLRLEKSIEFSNKERILLEALSDGLRHSKRDLAYRIDPELGQTDVVTGIINLRKKLEPTYNIVCVYSYRRYYYQLVRSLYSPYDGVH